MWKSWSSHFVKTFKKLDITLRPSWAGRGLADMHNDTWMIEIRTDNWGVEITQPSIRLFLWVSSVFFSLIRRCPIHDLGLGRCRLRPGHDDFRCRAQTRQLSLPPNFHITCREHGHCEFESCAGFKKFIEMKCCTCAAWDQAVGCVNSADNGPPTVEARSPNHYIYAIGTLGIFL